MSDTTEWAQRCVANGSGHQDVATAAQWMDLWGLAKDALEALELVDGLHDASLTSALSRSAHRSLVILKLRAALND